MPLVRLRVKIETGSADDVQEHEHEIIKEYDYVASCTPRLNSTTAWVGPTEMPGMPDVVDVLVENTDSADDIRLYHKFGSSAYKNIAPGESCLWVGVPRGTSPNEWRIIGQGAGLVDCKVTILGDY